MLNLTDIKIDPELFDFIHKITLFEINTEKTIIQKIIPAANCCLSYNMNDIPVFCSSKEHYTNCERLLITGPKTSSTLYVKHKGSVKQILIEFTPTGFFALFNQSPSEFRNSLIPLNYIMPATKVENLESKLSDVNDVLKASKVLQKTLAECTIQSLKVDKRIEDTILEFKKGITSVKDISEKFNISERHFNRLFNKIVGCSPKVYLKINQIHNILKKLGKGRKERMTDIAYDNGFFDQSHYNKSFKKMTNMSPGDFLKSKEHVSIKYYSK